MITTYVYDTFAAYNRNVKGRTAYLRVGINKNVDVVILLRKALNIVDVFSHERFTIHNNVLKI